MLHLFNYCVSFVQMNSALNHVKFPENELLPSILPERTRVCAKLLSHTLHAASGSGTSNPGSLHTGSLTEIYRDNLLVHWIDRINVGTVRF